MAELASAKVIIAFADQCFKYGKKFVERCRTYLHAEEEAIKLLVSIECNWVKMETQIKIIKKVAPSLDKRLQDMQSQVLSQLEGKLKTASFIIEQLKPEKFPDGKEKKVKKSDWKHDGGRNITNIVTNLSALKPARKVKFVMKRDALYAIVDDIEKWQARYDPSWILIMQMSIGGIDDELHEAQKKPEPEQIPIIMAAKGLRDAARANQDSRVSTKTIWIEESDLDLNPQDIPYSTMQVSKLMDEKEMVVIDTMVCNPSAININVTTKDVRNLARMLAEVDPSTFGLLKCRGVIKIPRPGTVQQLVDFKFIFDVPHKLTNPQSLRNVLLSEKPYPLDERLELAKKVTSSILFLHTVQFVHKNIRPETIAIFQNDYSEIGTPFLVGFEQFRLEEGATFRSGDDLWHHNLYRHPSRQGTQPELDYKMQHDIYSLGVVLLEIGLWTSFVQDGFEGDSKQPILNSILEPENIGRAWNPLVAAAENKQNLEALATRELPPRVGKRYTDVVLLCLRCLDSSNGKEGDEKGFGASTVDLTWTDEDGIVIGVRFIESVLMKMQEITM